MWATFYFGVLASTRGLVVATGTVSLTETAAITVTGVHGGPVIVTSIDTCTVLAVKNAFSTVSVIETVTPVLTQRHEALYDLTVSSTATVTVTGSGVIAEENLLLETGDDLLLETGDLVLLE